MSTVSCGGFTEPDRALFYSLEGHLSILGPLLLLGIEMTLDSAKNRNILGSFLFLTR